MNTANLINYATLQSSSIQDSVGNTYGSVTDVILNRQTGQAEFLVIGTGGILGIGKDYFVVPFHSVDITPNTDKIILNTTKEKIEQAPRFDKDKLSKWSEEERQELLTYYGVADLYNSAHRDSTGYREPSLADQKHQAYEGSSQITNAPQISESNTEKNVNYDKLKGIE